MASRGDAAAFAICPQSASGREQDDVVLFSALEVCEARMRECLGELHERQHALLRTSGTLQAHVAELRHVLRVQREEEGGTSTVKASHALARSDPAASGGCRSREAAPQVTGGSALPDRQQQEVAQCGEGQEAEGGLGMNLNLCSVRNLRAEAPKHGVMDFLPHVLQMDQNVEDIAIFTSQLKHVGLDDADSDGAEDAQSGGERSLASRSRVVSVRAAARVSRFFESVVFERAVHVAIILNVLFLGYMANVAVENPDLEPSDFVTWVSAAFNVFYALELCGKLTSSPYRFFAGVDWRWNLFDLAIVLFSAYDLLAPNFGSIVGADVTFLRALRLMRVSKVLRTFRAASFFRELRQMLAGIACSIRPLFWCILMLVLFLYVFALVFVYACIEVLTDEAADEEARAEMLLHYGSVGVAMLSLFQAFSGGDDWAALAAPLRHAGPIYYGLFVFFVVFVVIAVNNVIFGIFLDNALRIANADRDGNAVHVMQEERESLDDFTRLFKTIETREESSSGFISQVNFENYMDNPLMRAFYSVLGLEIWDPRALFTTLCSLRPGLQADGEAATLDMDAFVDGCMRLRGPARSADVYALRVELDKLGDAVRHIGRELQAASAAQHMERESHDSQEPARFRVMPLADVRGCGGATPDEHPAREPVSPLSMAL